MPQRTRNLGKTLDGTHVRQEESAFLLLISKRICTRARVIESNKSRLDFSDQQLCADFADNVGKRDDTALQIARKCS